eukprot:scaffold6933_cov178-Amphora_coffeaeformis.AAC.5
MKLPKMTLTALTLVLSSGAVYAYDNFWFWKLGHLDGPHTSSKALGISRDGHTAVGETLVVKVNHVILLDSRPLLTRAPPAWRCDVDWIMGTTEQPPLYNELFVQEDLGIVAPAYPTAAYAASDMVNNAPGENCSTYDKLSFELDWCGSTVVGAWDAKTVSYGVQWLSAANASYPSGDYVQIADFGGGISEMKVKDVSQDGNTMVGYGHNRRGPLAFRINSLVLNSDSLPILRTLSIVDANTKQTLQTSKATAVSEDGTIIAGTGYVKSGSRPFVTTVLSENDTALEYESTILPMIGGGKYAECSAVTPDGRFIAGRCDSPKGPQACIWYKNSTDTDEWFVKGLGGLAEKIVDSTATGIVNKWNSTSGVDDLMVVGFSNTNLYGSEAFVWSGGVDDEDFGYFYDLEYILTKTGTGEASGMGSDWVLNQATGISASGDRIVGWGNNPEGNIEAWVVTGYPAFLHELEFTHE